MAWLVQPGRRSCWRRAVALQASESAEALAAWRSPSVLTPKPCSRSPRLARLVARVVSWLVLAALLLWLPT